jgi:uncharacterized protein (UPF0332 family)
MSATPDDTIRYRMERAKQTIIGADVLAEEHLWNGCANRVYYACFYAVSALMARDGASTSKHTGVRSFLNQHYVRMGRLDRDLGDFYNALFDTRLDGDYEDLLTFDEEKVRPLIVEARRFIARIEELLQVS